LLLNGIEAGSGGGGGIGGAGGSWPNTTVGNTIKSITTKQ